MSNSYLDYIFAKNGGGSGKVQLFVPYAKVDKKYSKEEIDKKMREKYNKSMATPSYMGLPTDDNTRKNEIDKLVEDRQNLEHESTFLGNNYVCITGYTTQEFEVTLKNNWGINDIFSGIQNMTNFMQLFGSENQTTWLSATQACWQGTDPITFPLSFYLFSKNWSSNIMNAVAPLVRLASAEYGTGSGKLSGFSALVHAGYSAKYGDNVKNYEFIEASKKRDRSFGTVSIRFSNLIYIDNLLLESIKVTHSQVRVPSGDPLYLKVDCQFRTASIPTVEDIKHIYGSIGGFQDRDIKGTSME